MQKKKENSLQLIRKEIDMKKYRRFICLTYKLLKRDEFRHSVFDIMEIFARSIRSISSAEHPSNDGNSLKFLASDKTLLKRHNQMENRFE